MTKKEKTKYLVALSTPHSEDSYCNSEKSGIIDHYGEYVRYTDGKNLSDVEKTLQSCRKDELIICAFWQIAPKLFNVRKGRYGFDRATHTVTAWRQSSR